VFTESFRISKRDSKRDRGVYGAAKRDLRIANCKWPMADKPMADKAMGAASGSPE